MNGTALYRALVHAGAPEDEAKEAADGVESINVRIDAKIESIENDITELKVMVAELRVTNRILIALVLAILIKSFF